MNVTLYKSTDGSAPVLTGAAGSLLALLDAVLVNGYGAKAAAGWTKPFANAANKGCYLQNTTGSNNPSGMGFTLDDSGPGGGTFREARVQGFETLTSATAGTGPFPTAAQSLIGTGALVIRKSATADATARAWTILATGQTFYLFIETGDQTNPLGTSSFAYGDFRSYKNGDQYAVMIIGRMVENSANTYVDPMHCQQLSNGSTFQVTNTTMFGHFVARHWTGIGGAIRFGKPSPVSYIIHNWGSAVIGQYTSETQLQGATTNSCNVCMGRYAFSQAWPSPNGPDSAIMLAPQHMTHNFSMRGYLYGIWQPMHDRPLGHGDTFSVAGGNLNGKSFMAINIMAYIASLGDAGQIILETSSTWS